jgi:hypothetical protein
VAAPVYEEQRAASERIERDIARIVARKGAVKHMKIDLTK